MTATAPDFELFQDRIGRWFAMQSPEGGIVEMSLADCALSDETTGSFTLTFRAGPGTPGQATYVLEADGLPPTPVFLVPARELADGGLEYHAVFNHRRPNDTKDVNARE